MARPKKVQKYTVYFKVRGVADSKRFQSVEGESVRDVLDKFEAERPFATVLSITGGK